MYRQTRYGEDLPVSTGRTRPWMKPLIIGLVVAAVILAVAYPLFHWLIFGILIRKSIWIISIVILVAYIFKLFIDTARQYETTWKDWMKGLGAVGVWSLFYLWQVHAYGTAVAYGFQPEITSDIPQISSLRYLPLEVATNYLNNQQTDPTKKVGDPDPLTINGKFYWVAPRVPNGPLNSLSARTDAILVEDDATGRVDSPVPQNFRCGENMAFANGIAWQLRAKKFFAEYPEIYYIPSDNGWLGVAPYVSYGLHFPAVVPYWGGVLTFDANCQMRDLSPEQAQADPTLRGYRIFPEALAKMYSGSWGYRYGGLLNIVWGHTQQVEIPTLASSNQPPYYLETSWGPLWMMPTEPFGGNDNTAVYKIFWFDARTGKALITELGSRHLTGPNQGIQFVKAKTPGFAWIAGNSGTHVVLEPRPITRAGDPAFYWMYTITTGSSSGVAVTALLDATNVERVYHFCTYNSLEAWLAGRGSSDGLPCNTGTSPSPASPVPATGAPVSPSTDLGGLTDDELLRRMQDIVNEMTRRRGR